MSVSGKAILYTSPDAKTIYLAVHNRGTQALGVTQNYFANAKEARTSDDHDDTNYGHGLECLPDSWSYQEFPVGGKYNALKISLSGFLRIGLRDAAFGVAKIPPPGTHVDLDLAKDLTWYAGNARSNAHDGTGVGDGYLRASQKQNVEKKNPFITQIEAMLRTKNKGPEVAGLVRITPNFAPSGGMTHWIVRFENTGKSPFIGTVVFKDAKKNAGIGLESMALPKKSSAAEQRIEANGNYGLQARVGSPVRVGVRGWGYGEMELPRDEPVTMMLHELARETTQMNPKFFDRAEVMKKQREKMASVRFFDGKRPINDALKPLVMRGAEAVAHSTLPSPSVHVRSVPSTDETPGGGWIIEVKSFMPPKDGDGKLGFVGTLKLQGQVDPAQLPPKRFERPGDLGRWFLPRNNQIGSATARAGAELVIGTRGTGWFTALKLPAIGKVVDVPSNSKSWAFRPDQFNRDQLAEAFIGDCQRGPDERGPVAKRKT